MKSSSIVVLLNSYIKIPSYWSLHLYSCCTIMSRRKVELQSTKVKLNDNCCSIFGFTCEKKPVEIGDSSGRYNFPLSGPKNPI